MPAGIRKSLAAILAEMECDPDSIFGGRLTPADAPIHAYELKTFVRF
jgi:hypothetical protein